MELAQKNVTMFIHGHQVNIALKQKISMLSLQFCRKTQLLYEYKQPFCSNKQQLQQTMTITNLARNVL